MDTKSKLPLNVRIIIAILVVPSLILGSMLMSALINQNTTDLTFFEVIYALVGVFAMYIALIGKKLF